MIRGLYTSGWGMMAIEKKMDVVSNNLANVNTSGYKKDTVVFESFPNLLTQRINDSRSPLNPSGKVGNMQLGSDVGAIYTYYRQGQLQRTDNRLDAAISDSDTAFFTVRVPGGNGDGQEYYTRDGSFALNADGTLVTKDGYIVMGENGPITLEGDQFVIEADGSVIQNGEVVDKLQIAEFANPESLRKFGSNLVQTTDETQMRDFSGTVRQGFVEQSNVNIIREMVDMITVMRSYEANQKILQFEDGTLDKAVNEVGALR